jgi:hypothetical protein
MNLKRRDIDRIGGTQMAGYSGTPLEKKLGIKEGFRILIVNEPAGFRSELGILTPNVIVYTRSDEEMDLILFFVKTSNELELSFTSLARRLVQNGMLWVCWPKKTSGVSSDLNFDVVQKTGLAIGLVDTKICAVNEVWSGLKFVIRVKDREAVEHTSRKIKTKA